MAKRTRRCQLHPDGCTKHANPTPARRPVRRPPAAVLRGSIATHVALVLGGGRRPIRVPRGAVEGGRG